MSCRINHAAALNIGSQVRSISLAMWLNDSEGLQHRPDARHFVRAKQVGLAQRGQHGKERLRTTHLLAEILEGVRQRVANRKTQRPQPERIQENRHLVAHPYRAVLQVRIVKTKPWIEDDLFHAVAGGEFDLARE